MRERPQCRKLGFTNLTSEPWVQPNGYRSESFTDPERLPVPDLHGFGLVVNEVGKELAV